MINASLRKTAMVLALAGCPGVAGHAQQAATTEWTAPRGTAVVVGRVVYENGKPAVNVPVVAVMQRKAQWQLIKGAGLGMTNFNDEPGVSRWPQLRGVMQTLATTQADGTYHLNGLTTAPYNLMVAASSNYGGFLKAPDGWIATAVEGAWSKEGQVTRRTRDIVLTRGGTIEGQVVDKITGQPLAGVNIAHNGPHCPASGDRVMFAISDQAGRFSCRVAPGTTELYIAGPSMNDLAGNVRFADTGESANVYVIKTNQGPYAGSGQVEFVIDDKQPQYGLGSGQKVKVETRLEDSKTITLRLRKLVPASHENRVGG